MPRSPGPGLALAGYTGRFAPNRLHVFGETEITYLHSLPPEQRKRSLEQFFEFDLPCIFVTKGQEVPAEMVELAKARGVPVFRSKLKTAEFYRRIKPIVEEAFAPRTTLHGSLADVYGVGLLFVGRSGIGKSECVLDLVERGHRLVADDVVQVTRRGNDVLIGRGHELAAHHMEIRGIGLIDIPALFGVRAVRQQKRIEVVVQLEDWENAKDTDRTGLGREETDDSRCRGPPGRGAPQPRQEHHGDLRSGRDDAPAPLLGRGRRRGVQRPAHQADEGAAGRAGISPGRL